MTSFFLAFNHEIRNDSGNRETTTITNVWGNISDPKLEPGISNSGTLVNAPPHVKDGQGSSIEYQTAFKPPSDLGLESAEERTM